MKKRRKALETCVLAVALVMLIILFIVSCGRSQPASSLDIPEAVNTSHEVDERGFSHMNQAFLIDQDGMVRRQYLGIQIGGQVLPVEDMLEDIGVLLGSS